MSADIRITKAIIWAQKRLDDCDRTQRESSSKQSRDWAYGESVAINAMLRILVAPVKCMGCDDTRSTSCGAADCPIPIQIEDTLSDDPATSAARRDAAFMGREFK